MSMMMDKDGLGEWALSLGYRRCIIPIGLTDFGVGSNILLFNLFHTLIRWVTPSGAVTLERAIFPEGRFEILAVRS